MITQSNIPTIKDSINKTFDNIDYKINKITDQEIQRIENELIEEREKRYIIRKKISEGLLTPEQSKELYNISTFENFKPLPEILYHVTTRKSKVEQEGLKTRDELNIQSGYGLGGGQSDTISFTTSLEIATAIKKGIIEAHNVLNNKITLSNLINQAKLGIGAFRPWLSNMWGVENPDEDKNAYLYWLIKGLDYEEFRMINAKKESEMIDWTPIDEPNHAGLHTKFIKELTPHEYREKVFDFYKSWSGFREFAGGQYDPLFFNTDAKALAETPITEIEILKFRSKPNAKGIQQSAMGEWRTFSGKAVELIS